MKINCPQLVHQQSNFTTISTNTKLDRTARILRKLDSTIELKTKTNTPSILLPATDDSVVPGSIAKE